MKLTKKQRGALDDMLDRDAAHGGDVASKVDSNGKYIRTSWDLCEEIVEEIAKILIARTNHPVTENALVTALLGKKILVVDTVEFVPVLLAFGAEKCNITYVAPYKYKGAMIAGAIGVRVVQHSLLDWKSDMKFDVVVGNPPYQDENQRPIVLKFIKLFFEHTVKNGYTVMVGPTSWVNGTMPQDTTRSVSSAFSFINSHQILYYNSNVNAHFKSVGKDIGYWVARNAPNTGNSFVVDHCGEKFNVSTAGFDYLPYFLSKNNWQIFLKIQQYSTEFWSRFSNLAPAKIGAAIVFPKAQYISIDALCVFDGIDKAGLPTSKLVIAHKIPDGQFNSAKIQFKSKLFRFLFHIYGGNSGCSPGFLRKFPMLKDITSEKELYERFDLSQDEIDFIETTVK